MTNCLEQKDIFRSHKNRSKFRMEVLNGVKKLPFFFYDFIFL
ncbi:hypothetical protein BSM4216_0248 [Bacillus smithii]|nr:hypothetical protein BSM4216_0248 [Bacillus smithii]